MLKDVTPAAEPKALPSPAPSPAPETTSTTQDAYPPGRYSRTKCAHMKSIGAWNNAIHTIDDE